MGVEDLHVGLRPLANRWLIDTCTIQRSTSTRTSAGTTVTWADLATNVPCSVQPGGVSGEASGARGGITAQADWVIRLPAGQDVTVKDRIVYGARTFEVQMVEAKTFEVRRKVGCVEIT